MTFGVAACAERPPADLTSGIDGATPLVGRALVWDIPFGEVTDLVATEERLYIVDAHNTPGLYVLDRGTGGVIHTWGVEGEGPGEFRVPLTVADLDTTEMVIWIFDAALQRVTRITEGVLNGTDTLPPQTTQLREVQASVVRAGADGRWLTAGRASAGRLGVVLRDGTPAGAIGVVPGNADELPASVRARADPVVFRPRGDGSIVVASRRAGRIEILEESGELRALAAVPVPFEPIYQLSDDDQLLRPVLNSRSRGGYSAVAVNEDGIFALFSGRTIEEMTMRRLHLANLLHEFDWNGQLRHVWTLDREVSQIALSPDGTELYAAAVEPVPEIVVYPLRR